MNADETTPPRTGAERLAIFVATGFGSGLAPVAPGTFGSAAALGIVIALSYTSLPAFPTLVTLAAAATIACLVVGRTAERVLGEKDPGSIVIDEFAGMFVALALPGAGWMGPREWIAAFFLFRVFDIIKPPPARRLQSLRGGLGIVIDDLIAGLYALAGVFVVHDLAQRAT
jgi:phosphatidylglycerophosphatase A